MKTQFLLGDEAIGLGAIDAGITAAYAYPGTPSTEILQYLIDQAKEGVDIHAAWTANEKVSYEEALGTSYVGRRVLVAMKHVGLNVAADSFMSSTLTSINGGLVLVVADDPGMFSSQNEQDSRVYADFARIICLEPATAQEAYDMTREAFDISEKFHIPVMIRMVTRVCHTRALVEPKASREQNPIKKALNPNDWILVPSNARRHWSNLLEQQAELHEYTENSDHNKLTLADQSLGIITTGMGYTHLLEQIEDLDFKPSTLHIKAYPVPEEKIRQLAEHTDKMLILEEGYPIVERLLRGVLPSDLKLAGKLTGEIEIAGELDPSNVRKALNLPEKKRPLLSTFDEASSTDLLSGRPPQLCKGCPHIDSYGAIKEALEPYSQHYISSDIGCYTLGALPPYSAIESCVCMGASIGMAKGSSDAGFYPVVATIGDSTFLHSGIPSLLDAIATNTDMTLVILDNEAVAMTGGQPTLVPSSRLKKIILGLGINPEHFHEIIPLRPHRKENVEIIRKEIEYHGLSVIIALRECVETAKRHKVKKVLK